MFTPETPIEIWADYLEDKGHDVGQLRAWIEMGLTNYKYTDRYG